VWASPSEARWKPVVSTRGGGVEGECKPASLKVCMDSGHIVAVGAHMNKNAPVLGAFQLPTADYGGTELLVADISVAPENLLLTQNSWGV
jgi:hypothetical protein